MPNDWKSKYQTEMPNELEYKRQMLMAYEWRSKHQNYVRQNAKKLDQDNKNSNCR